MAHTSELSYSIDIYPPTPVSSVTIELTNLRALTPVIRDGHYVAIEPIDEDEPMSKVDPAAELAYIVSKVNDHGTYYRDYIEVFEDIERITYRLYVRSGKVVRVDGRMTFDTPAHDV